MAQTIHYTVFDSDLGRIWISATEKGINRVQFVDVDEDELAEAMSIAYRAVVIEDKIRLHKIRDDVLSYLSGKPTSFRAQLDFSEGTQFQRDVWKTTRRIPYGRVRSYKWVAGEVGSPKAARAVGQALSSNPVPLLVPCHRVVMSDGSLGGFVGGTDYKKRLLSIEHGQFGMVFEERELESALRFLLEE
jgi:O-6-methylguanine DNA methyltransferase